MARKVREARTLEGTVEQLRSAIEDALQRMSASSIVWLPDHSRVNARLSANVWSWGEDIEVTVDREEVTIESSCRLSTQFFDWGKNRSNVDHLFQFIDEAIANSYQGNQSPRVAEAQRGGNRMSQPVISLDCSACKTPQSMKAATVPRFGGFIRFLGVIIVIPSVVGVALATIFFISTSMVASEQLTKATSDAANAGTVLGAGIGYGISVFIGASSLVGGLIGWLLLTSRKVYKCIRCSFILERA